MHIGSAASTTLAVNPPDSYVTVGKTLNVTVNVADVVNLTSWQFTLYFSNSILNCTNAFEGPFLRTSGGSTYFNKQINNTAGSVLVYCTLLGNYAASGSGVLATISFNASSMGDTTLHLNETKLGDEKIPPQPIIHTTIDGSAHVQKYTLTVSTVGSGSVNLNNTGPYYHYGEVVMLTAVPFVGWSFQNWSGDLIGSVNPATLAIAGNMSVTAHFTTTGVKPMLNMNPENRTCRKFNEAFTVQITITNASSVEDFRFEIHYNATLLDVTGISWNAWSSGTYTADELNGILTGYTSGSPISGNTTLVTITFNATYHHIWKDESTVSGWKNNQTGTIYFQWTNLSYASGPDLRYERGGLNQIDVGPDFTYTFSPIQGDVNNDGTVDIIDLRTVAIYFLVRQGDPNWPAASTYDLNGDEIIDIVDLRTVALNYGYTYVP